jgi:uncharacterized integral membrane protein (TIGR00698 family)
MSENHSSGHRAARLAPGIALSGVVAVAASYAAVLASAHLFPLPAIVIALFIGIALNQVAKRPAFIPGLTFCVKTLLRWAVALIGLRVAVGEILALGLATAVLVVAAMAMTLLSGFVLARLFDQGEGFGALAGAGTAICGASATLATATVLPDYRGKEAEIVFVVVAVNALSTVAMVTYPLLCAWLGFDPQTTGVMLGATIHDVAQVVGAGYSVSEPVGNTAVIVKLFRVLLLLPVVLAVGFWITRSRAQVGRVPVPGFALVFLVLCLLNSVVPEELRALDAYSKPRAWLLDASRWGLLSAISALGLGTSVAAMTSLGWRHVATMVGTTIVILALVVLELLFLL